MKSVFHIRLDPREVGASLAHMPSDEQAAALSEFCRELRAQCGTNYNAELQLAYVRGELNPADRELLTMLGDVG